MGIAAALAVIACAPAAASATVWCVPNTAPCLNGGGTSAGSIGSAISMATNGDTIVIAAGSYNETPNDPFNKALTFVGAGPTQTLIAPTGTMNSLTTFTVADASSTVSDLGVVLENGTSEVGMQLSGSAHNVAVTAPALATMNEAGVQAGTGSFVGGSITLPNTSSTTGFAGPQAATVADSSITAGTGISGSPTARRVRITANIGALLSTDVSTITATFDDLLIVLVAGASAPQGVSVSSSGMFGPTAITATLRHLTVIGDGEPGSVGVASTAVPAGNPATTQVTLASSILRGLGHALTQSASGSGQTANLSVDYSDYDPAGLTSSDTTMGAGSISPGPHSLNVDPSFVSTSASASDPAHPDEFTLPVTSPVVDAGDPAALATGEPTTDLAGNPRVVQGRPGGPRTDMGAFEFQSHPPSVTAAAGAVSVAAGAPVAFTAFGSDPDAGDVLTYAWRADDGATGTGPVFSHAFTTAGSHSVMVTATDLEGFTSMASAAVTVTPAPPSRQTSLPVLAVLSGLSLKPSAFPAAPSGPSAVAAKRRRFGSVISYRDSQVARTTFTVQRPQAGLRKGRSCVKPTAKLRRKHARHCTRFVSLGSFARADAAGANRFRFAGRIRGRRLSPGSYRLQAVATDAAGAGRPVYGNFRIIR
jgi:PKD domain